MRPVSGKEVKDALFSIPDIKSPGPDGYTSKFFKDVRGEVWGDVIEAVQDFFLQRRLLTQINATTLTLIPKCDRPQNKAYDTVEWQFVEQLMRLLRFPPEFKSMERAQTSKGDTKSMMLLLQSFSTFSKACGLKISAAKSNAYFRGVPDQIKNDILRISGFTDGALPFKYLGMPIQTTRHKKVDCACLIEKICGRIHSYGARKFSYAGRLILVKSVLNTLHSYWASMFILPKEYKRVPLVAWDKICKPNEEGGLGLRIRKRGTRQWWGICWVWRRICKVKQEIAHGFVDGVWVVQPSGYTPTGCYEWLWNASPPVCWNKVIWNNWALPKNQFIGWLVAHEVHNTVDKIASYGIDVDDRCLLCGQSEKCLSHLFFACQYSKRVILALQQSTGCNLPLVTDLVWWSSRGCTIVQRGAQIALFLGALYSIWYQRNRCRIDKVLMHPSQLDLQIVDGVRSRIRGREKLNMNVNDITWLSQKNLI
ncbi:uncharacterized protein LOC141632218 [Silene latifolia]|uniref:uncharacterized protein LOC141632218 n=1 Tax=Silene latifolia TaxID=37657 RepID=UPI003D7825E6